MAKENEINSTEVQINGKKYDYNDLTEEQIYLLRQTQSCRVKINNLKFELDQVQVALTSFNQKLISSVENKSERKMGTTCERRRCTATSRYWR